MPVNVVDASAPGARVFGEPEAETVAKQLSKSTLVAPQLLWFEPASSAFKKTANHPGLAGQIRAAFQMAGRLAIETLSVDHLDVIYLAAQVGLTTHDASNVQEAQELDGAAFKWVAHLANFRNMKVYCPSLMSMVRSAPRASA